MGIRFRKSFKVSSGVKINLNKKSASVTLGKKGAHYTINTNGTKTKSVGVPGTGLYYTERTGEKKKSKEAGNRSAHTLTTSKHHAKKSKSEKSDVFLHDTLKVDSLSDLQVIRKKRTYLVCGIAMLLSSIVFILCGIPILFLGIITLCIGVGYIKISRQLKTELKKRSSDRTPR